MISQTLYSVSPIPPLPGWGHKLITAGSNKARDLQPIYNMTTSPDFDKFESFRELVWSNGVHHIAQPRHIT